MTTRIFRPAVLLVAAVALLVPAGAGAGAVAGDLDSDFGEGGKVVTKVGKSSRAISVVPADHGAIYVAGTVERGPDNASDMIVLRYKRNGALDKDFSKDGMVSIDFKDGNDAATALALQPDGRIVVVGFSSRPADPFDPEFSLARLRATGRLDRDFSGDGKVRTSLGDGRSEAADLVVQGNGKIVVGGTQYEASGRFALARYTKAGHLDDSFGDNGKVVEPVPSAVTSTAGGVAVGGGKIYLGGQSSPAGTDWNFTAARFDSAGGRDESFSGDGFATASLSPSYDGAFDIELDANGLPVLTGEADNSDSSAGGYGFARFEDDGDLDATFNPSGSPAGTQRAAFAAGPFSEFANAFEFDADDRIVAIGLSSADNLKSDFGLLRLGMNGGVDTGFSPGVPAGIGFTDFLGASDIGFDVAVLTNEKIVAVGSTKPPDSTNSRVAVARYLGGVAG